MFTLKSNKIEDFPFELYSDLNLSDLEEQAKEHHLNSYNSWMLPQIVAYLATWQLYYKHLPHGSYVDQRETLVRNVSKHDHWAQGLWRVIKFLKRSSLVKQQIDPKYTNYSALVPLVWSAHKRYNGIKYNQWALEQSVGENYLLENNLFEAITWELDCDTQSGLNYDWDPEKLQFGIPQSRLQELRQIGLPNTGTKRDNPVSNWCLRNTRLTELKDSPKLLGTMLTQIWVAHPTLRTQLMILDPNHWDEMPPPLIETELFKQIPKRYNPDFDRPLPWTTV